MKHISNQTKLILVIMIIIAFYVGFAIHTDIGKINEHFSKINFTYFSLIIPILIFSQFLRSIIQKIILTNLGVSISFKSSFELFISGLSMIVTPFGSGQLIKSYFLKQKYGHPISKTFLLVFIERFYDLFAISFVLIFTLFYLFTFQAFLSGLVSFILASILFFISNNNYFLKNLFSFSKKIKFLKTPFENEADFIKSIRCIMNLKIFLLLLPSVFLITLLEGLVIYIGFLSLDIELSYLESIQIFYTSILLGVLSLIPGGVGVVEGSLTTLLINNGLSLSLAASAVILIRFTTIWYSTVSGFILSIIKFSRNDIFFNAK